MGGCRIAALLLLVSCGCLRGQWAQIGWDRVVEGLNLPTLALGAGDGSGRLFVVELGGQVRIVRDGKLVEKPFLDLSSRVGFDVEAGLLSIAFPPKFAERKHFYADFIDADRNVVIARFKVSDDLDVADVDSEEILLTIPQPFGQHNGGIMAFSPVDGMLYISTGDGGIELSGEEEYRNDPLNNGQNPGVLLGKILRIDTESGATPYAIPPDNPKKPGWLPEVWSIGWRNPWRFSFDRANGDLYVGDVGAEDFEEVDYEPAGMGGLNYGWSVREGIHCVHDKACEERGDLVDPAIEYDHDRGCSVTGGVVYRGAKFPELNGAYFYADFCKSTVWAMKRVAGMWQSGSMGPSRALAVSFGEDDEGEIYLVDHKGSLLKMKQIEPGLTVTSVGNSASGEPGLAAGSIASAFTTGLPDVTEPLGYGDFPLPFTLGDVSVWVNGTQVRLTALTPEGKVDFQAPYVLPEGKATVQVRAGYRSSNVFQVDVKPVLPGLLSVDGRRAMAVNEQGENSVSAARGTMVALFATGLGWPDNAPEYGFPGLDDPPSTLNGVVTAAIGGKPAEVQFCSLTPGFPGIFTIIAKIAPDAAVGEGEIWIAVSGVKSLPLQFGVN